jgi:hypothetical protein
MSSYPPPGPDPKSSPRPSVDRRIEEAIERIEAELRQAVAYVNDAVVPQVRRESISAMRNMADALHKLADRIDSRSKPPAGHPTPPPEDPRS